MTCHFYFIPPIGEDRAHRPCNKRALCHTITEITVHACTTDAKEHLTQETVQCVYEVLKQ